MTPWSGAVDSTQPVAMASQAVVREVHMRIASPPVIHTGRFGINTSHSGRLISAKQDEARMWELIGADTLANLNLETLNRAVGTGHGLFSA